MNPFKDVETFLNAVGQNPPANPVNEYAVSDLYKELIKEEIDEFWEADAANDDVERLDACFDMIWVIVGYARSRGWDMDKAWAHGAATNLSKIDPVTGLVRRREDGKILKPEGWTPPDFAPFVK